jgi:hypothetical protein
VLFCYICFSQFSKKTRSNVQGIQLVPGNDGGGLVLRDLIATAMRIAIIGDGGYELLRCRSCDTSIFLIRV